MLTGDAGLLEPKDLEALGEPQLPDIALGTCGKAFAHGSLKAHASAKTGEGDFEHAFKEFIIRMYDADKVSRLREAARADNVDPEPDPAVVGCRPGKVVDSYCVLQ